MCENLSISDSEFQNCDTQQFKRGHWGDSLVSKMLVQVWGPELDPQHPHKGSVPGMSAVSSWWGRRDTPVPVSHRVFIWWWVSPASLLTSGVWFRIRYFIKSVCVVNRNYTASPSPCPHAVDATVPPQSVWGHAGLLGTSLPLRMTTAFFRIAEGMGDFIWLPRTGKFFSVLFFFSPRELE